MAASSNKSLGAQIAAVIFALISVICGAGWYMAVDKATQDISRAAKAEGDFKKEQNTTKQLLTDIDQFKQATGHNQPVVGTVEQADPGSAVGDVLKDVASAVQEGAQARTEKEAIAGLIQDKARIKADAIPMGRFAEPAEVAEMVTLLCSPAGRYITGQTLHVNGGVYLP